MNVLEIKQRIIYGVATGILAIGLSACGGQAALTPSSAVPVPRQAAIPTATLLPPGPPLKNQPPKGPDIKQTLNYTSALALVNNSPLEEIMILPDGVSNQPNNPGEKANSIIGLLDKESQQVKSERELDFRFGTNIVHIFLPTSPDTSSSIASTTYDGGNLSFFSLVPQPKETGLDRENILRFYATLPYLIQEYVKLVPESKIALRTDREVYSFIFPFGSKSAVLNHSLVYLFSNRKVGVITPGNQTYAGIDPRSNSMYAISQSIHFQTQFYQKNTDEFMVLEAGQFIEAVMGVTSQKDVIEIQDQENAGNSIGILAYSKAQGLSYKQYSDFIDRLNSNKAQKIVSKHTRFPESTYTALDQAKIGRFVKN